MCVWPRAIFGYIHFTSWALWASKAIICVWHRYFFPFIQLNIVYGTSKMTYIKTQSKTISKPKVIVPFFSSGRNKNRKQTKKLTEATHTKHQKTTLNVLVHHKVPHLPNVEKNNDRKMYFPTAHIGSECDCFHADSQCSQFADSTSNKLN